MKHFLILGTLLLGATVLTGVATAEDHQEKKAEKRYYDQKNKDYHVYNDREDRAYRLYLGDQHRDYRDFNRLNRNDRQEYFNWRHQHSDTLLKIDVN